MLEMKEVRWVFVIAQLYRICLAPARLGWQFLVSYWNYKHAMAWPARKIGGEQLGPVLLPLPEQGRCWIHIPVSALSLQAAPVVTRAKRGRSFLQAAIQATTTWGLVESK